MARSRSLSLVIASLVLLAGTGFAADLPSAGLPYGYVYAYSAATGPCTTAYAETDVSIDYEFPTAPQVDLLEYLDGSYLGTYDLSFFFEDFPQAAKFLNLENDFPISEPDTNFVYTWVMNFLFDGRITDSWEVTRNCEAGTANVRRLALFIDGFEFGSSCFWTATVGGACG